MSAGGALLSPVSAQRWSGKGWTITVTDTEMTVVDASGAVSVRSTQASRLEVRRRWFRWRLLSDGQSPVRLDGITKREAFALSATLRHRCRGRRAFW